MDVKEFLKTLLKYATSTMILIPGSTQLEYTDINKFTRACRHDPNQLYKHQGALLTSRVVVAMALDTDLIGDVTEKDLEKHLDKVIMSVFKKAPVVL
jgi:hypothetical protein